MSRHARGLEARARDLPHRSAAAPAARRPRRSPSFLVANGGIRIARDRWGSGARRPVPEQIMPPEPPAEVAPRRRRLGRAPPDQPLRFHLFCFDAEGVDGGAGFGGRRPQPRLADCAGLDGADLPAAVSVARAVLNEDPACERIEIWAQGRRRTVVARAFARRLRSGGDPRLAPLTLRGPMARGTTRRLGASGETPPDRSHKDPRLGDCHD
jgi:hypothetical protein